MLYRTASLIALAGGALLAMAATAEAAPIIVMRTLPGRPVVTPVHHAVMPGSDPRTWSPYPINNAVMPGSDPRTWSPYPINNRVMPGSDPRTWSPYPLYSSYRYYDNGPIPYWLQNPYWRQTMPASSPNPYVPYVNPYINSPYLTPYANPVSIGNLNYSGNVGTSGSFNLFE